MSNAAFLRRQAEEFLKRAEATERLDKLRHLPALSVVVFVRKPKVGRRLTYAGLVIENENKNERGPYEGRKWFVTHAGRYELGPFTDDKFIDWLIDGGVEDIDVVAAVAPLRDINLERIKESEKDTKE